ncbi:MAG: adenosylcobinamide-phosphate synthase CbiB [Porphyromonas sp.]|nr:adenosylcobinamide-phosphate synthase CbiB [Porphyromonas sp.]MDO4695179.1 adenosylcobinamide-phosphate synthase CbiB [Porphyromonas sp.]MDO4770925.1 adenosylcobinamide-phosphate synthase CbiB [Porphyromonas sp.]
MIPMFIGITLDSIIGDPYRMPHPIRLFGKVISWCDRRFNYGMHRKVKGTIVALSLVALTFMIFYLISFSLRDNDILRWCIESIFFFFGVCNHSLIKEAWKVEREVNKGDLAIARRQVGYIVGRDTSNLSFHQIRTATLETLAENLSDGVIAPLFFYAIGGIPLMMAYKMINTLDSMIGYKNDKYGDFGWFAARILDDGANYIPARLTAFIMVLLPPSLRGFKSMQKYARHHSSPNSGYPESALAGILDCQFGGPNIYHGKLVNKPYIGDNPREVTHSDIIKACIINAKTTAIMVFLIALISTFISCF